MHTIKRLFFVLAPFLILFSGQCHASPTANEFIPCDKIAVVSLEHCLRDKGNSCWLDSKTRYETCRKEVFKRHRPDVDRLKEKRAIKAEEERRAAETLKE